MHTNASCDSQTQTQASQQPSLRAEKATLLLLLLLSSWSSETSQAWHTMFNTAHLTVLEAELAYLRQQLGEIPALADQE
jgi:hypothetical protein